jgi:hypothetical protein
MPLLRPDQIELTFETALAAFWYKKPFEAFLRRNDVSPHDLQELNQRSKRAFLDWLFTRYERSERGHNQIRSIGESLCKKTTFTDLSPDQECAARQLIDQLRGVLLESDLQSAPSQQCSWHDQRQEQLADEAATRSCRLHSLESKLNLLFDSIGTSGAGVAFQMLVLDTARAWGLECRDPYSANGREFDGSIEVGEHVYLIESKFTIGPADAAAISNFRDKVLGNADLTQGLFISMSGYTQNAIENASRARSPVILLNGQHLIRALSGCTDFADIVRRARRCAAESGIAFQSEGEMYSVNNGQQRSKGQH